MPYGKFRKRTYRKRNYTRRTRVPKAVRFKSTKKSVIRGNYKKNVKQSRQIRTLFRLRYGSVQVNLHKTNVSFSPTQARPCLLNLNDFSCFRSTATAASTGCVIYQVNTTGNGLLAAARYDVAQNNNPFWAGAQKDFPDTGKYLIQGGYYRFRMTGIGRVVDTRVTFHLCKQRAGWMAKRSPLPGVADSHQTQFPYCLINMTGLTGGVGQKINPYYINVLASKTVYFNSDTDETTGSTQTTANTKWLSFKVKKMFKPMYQVYTKPSVPGTVEDTIATTDSHWEAGVTQADVRQGLFLVISCSSRFLAPDAGAISITSDRYVKWMDSNGSAAIY